MNAYARMEEFVLLAMTMKLSVDPAYALQISPESSVKKVRIFFRKRVLLRLWIK